MLTLIFILTCYGASNNIVFGSIFEGFRAFLAKFGTGGYSTHKLFTCMMCLPTWVGFVISYILIIFGYGYITPFGAYGLNNIYLSVFLHGLLSTGGVWFIHTIQEMCERAFIQPEVKEVPEKEEENEKILLND